MDEHPYKHPWCPADVFFLRDALRRGMKPTDVAGFLGKTGSEVEAKAKELKILVPKERGSLRGNEKTPT
jgi:hypothetical protein